MRIELRIFSLSQEDTSVVLCWLIFVVSKIQISFPVGLLVFQNISLSSNWFDCQDNTWCFFCYLGTLPDYHELMSLRVQLHYLAQN
jgi:hypothetical protein